MTMIYRILMSVLVVAALFVVRILFSPPPLAPGEAKRAAVDFPKKVFELDGLRRHTAKEVAGKIKLDVRLKLLPWCSFGDADAIKMELRAANSSRLLFSLESMDGNPANFTPVTHTLSYDGLRAGGIYTFEFPKPEDIVQLGIFICKDDERTGRCMGKPAEDINILLTRHMYPKKGYPAPTNDKIYYFRYLLFEDSQSITGIGEFQLREAGYVNLGTFIKSAFDEHKFAGSQTTYLEQAQQIDRTVSSYNPPEVSEIPEVIIPIQDSSKCRR